MVPVSNTTSTIDMNNEYETDAGTTANGKSSIAIVFVNVASAEWNVVTSDRGTLLPLTVEKGDHHFDTIDRVNENTIFFGGRRGPSGTGPGTSLARSTTRTFIARIPSRFFPRRPVPRPPPVETIPPATTAGDLTRSRSTTVLSSRLLLQAYRERGGQE